MVEQENEGRDFEGEAPLKWKGEEPSDEDLEAVLGENDFQNPWFLKKGWEASRPVCVLPQAGTAFLIDNHTIMTNFHVLRTPAYAEGLSAVFGYEEGPGGLALAPDPYPLDPNRLFFNNEDLDYAICAITGDPASKYGTIDITRPGRARMDGRVNIVQHPGAGLKKIAIRENGVKYIDDRTIQYWADTEHGSSGSPVFDEDWVIVGLHYTAASSNIEGKKISYNEAHRIDAICEDLKKQVFSFTGTFAYNAIKA
jgi:hypothetical protein